VEGQSAYYAVDIEEAAARLRESPERVREMLATGELEGIPPGATAQGDWKVLLPASPNLEQPAPADEPPERQEEGPAEGERPEEPAELPGALAEAERPQAATGESPRGDVAADRRGPTAPSGWVSTQQAARALGISPRTVRWHIEQGNLEAKPEGEGVRRSWLVSIDSLQAFRDARQAAGEMPRGRRAPAEGAAIAAGSPGDAVRELADRLAEEAARAAEYRVRLELTEQAASTVRAELEEERRRREAAERERDELRRLLETRAEERQESAETAAGAADAPPEERGDAVAPAPQPGRAEPPAPPVTGPREEPAGPRPWWRRIFGG
jgi:hypothetical protein